MNFSPILSCRAPLGVNIKYSGFWWKGDCLNLNFKGVVSGKWKAKILVQGWNKRK